MGQAGTQYRELAFSIGCPIKTKGEQALTSRSSTRPMAAGRPFHGSFVAIPRSPLCSALIGKAMEPVIQEEPTGCGIAASAALAGVSYAEAKKKANALGIYSADKSLWSETEHVRTLVREFGISVSPKETPFKTWESLPDKALLAIKWRTEHGKSFWHWVVFIREHGEAKVLDSKKALKSNTRKDFGRIKPKWYIEVSN